MFKLLPRKLTICNRCEETKEGYTCIRCGKYKQKIKNKKKLYVCSDCGFNFWSSQPNFNYYNVDDIYLFYCDTCFLNFKKYHYCGVASSGNGEAVKGLTKPNC